MNLPLFRLGGFNKATYIQSHKRNRVPPERRKAFGRSRCMKIVGMSIWRRMERFKNMWIFGKKNVVFYDVITIGTNIQAR